MSVFWYLLLPTVFPHGYSKVVLLSLFQPSTWPSVKKKEEKKKRKEKRKEKKKTKKTKVNQQLTVLPAHCYRWWRNVWSLIYCELSFGSRNQTLRDFARNQGRLLQILGYNGWLSPPEALSGGYDYYPRSWHLQTSREALKALHQQSHYLDQAVPRM